MSKRSYSSYSDPFGSASQLASYERMLKRPPARFIGPVRPVGRAVKGSYTAAKGTAKTYRSRASPAFKRAVTAILKSQKEQKLDVTNMYAGGVATVLATTETNLPDFQALAPFIASGNADGQRIGTDIRLTKSYVKFQLTLNQEASGDNGPFIATVWIGKVRALGAAVPNQADFSSLLVKGDGSFTAPTTTIPLTGLQPVNDDLWDIKVRKDYKLGKSGTLNATSNDFNLSYNDEIDVTRMFPRVLRYNGQSGVVQDDNLFFFVTYRTLNGAVPTGGLPQIVANVVHRYTDA